jgi:large subunit ribosomal protein L17
MHEQIKTTLPKAKELRRDIEKIITLARQDTVARRRLIFSRLRHDAAVKKLFGDVAIHYQNRPGGYVRILKCGHRVGDNAPVAFVQLVDRQGISLAAAEEESR